MRARAYRELLQHGLDRGELRSDRRVASRVPEVLRRQLPLSDGHLESRHPRHSYCCKQVLRSDEPVVVRQRGPHSKEFADCGDYLRQLRTFAGVDELNGERLASKLMKLRRVQHRTKFFTTEPRRDPLDVEQRAHGVFDGLDNKILRKGAVFALEKGRPPTPKPKHRIGGNVGRHRHKQLGDDLRDFIERLHMRNSARADTDNSMSTFLGI